VKAAPLDHLRAETVAEALDALATGEDARILAGGQSLVPVMARRLATPSCWWTSRAARPCGPTGATAAR
jgi:CO/xanthine dehydrogenase FAD-binding subunit